MAHICQSIPLDGPHHLHKTIVALQESLPYSRRFAYISVCLNQEHQYKLVCCLIFMALICICRLFWVTCNVLFMLLYILSIIMRKKIDNRIRVLIENGIATQHRSMFVIVGDKARDQVNYYYKVKYTILMKHFLYAVYVQRCFTPI